MTQSSQITGILCTLKRNVVINGANKEKDLVHMEKIKKEFFSKADLAIEHRVDDALIAVQGPKSAEIIQKFIKSDLKQVYFNNFIKEHVPAFGCQLIIYRTGYTGEDGFEISLPNSAAVNFTDAIFESKDLAPAGLGARDALRLEAGTVIRSLPARP